MKTIKKSVALILVAAAVFCLAACSGTKKEEFGAWYNNEFSPAYDAFVKTEYGMKNAPSPNLSLMIATDKYLYCIFDYITDGKQPENGKITEEDGAYTYTAKTFKQKVEFDEKTSSIRITNSIVVFGSESISSITTFTERSGKYYIQYFQPDFDQYYEVCFTAESGEVKNESIAEIPYTIFGEKIPDTFAKEN